MNTHEVPAILGETVHTLSFGSAEIAIGALSTGLGTYIFIRLGNRLQTGHDQLPNEINESGTPQ